MFVVDRKHVRTHADLLCKPLATHMAYEGFLSCVYSIMPNQSCRPRKHFSTDITVPSATFIWNKENYLNDRSICEMVEIVRLYDLWDTLLHIGYKHLAHMTDACFLVITHLLLFYLFILFNIISNNALCITLSIGNSLPTRV